MGDKHSEAIWTPEKTERFKKLVLKHVSNGGTVRDACQQFEFETNGIHKARTNQLKWILSFRYSCREEFKRALDLGLQAKMLKFEEFETQSEAIEMQEIKNDELAQKLYQAVGQIIEDRRQIAVSLQDYEQQVEYFEKRVQDLEEEKKMSELQFEKKEKELEKLNRDLNEKQFKYQQLVEDYQQMSTNNSKEHERLQYQLKELQNKYETLVSDYSRFRSNSAIEVERLETSLRDEQLRNTQLRSQYELVRNENATLTKRVTDFAHQISSALTAEEPVHATISPFPLRPIDSTDSSDASGL